MENPDLVFMRHALTLAEQAGTAGEVPIGAVIVKSGNIISTGLNQTITACDPTAHAEIVALRAAAQHIGNYRLIDCTLYVTLEPCPMCAGALVQARVRRVVYGAPDPRAGACGTVYDLLQSPHLNHRALLTGGVLAEPCAELLRTFFRHRRRKTAL